MTSLLEPGSGSRSADCSDELSPPRLVPLGMMLPLPSYALAPSLETRTWPAQFEITAVPSYTLSGPVMATGVPLEKSRPARVPKCQMLDCPGQATLLQTFGSSTWPLQSLS